jgi:hypothetical protein
LSRPSSENTFSEAFLADVAGIEQDKIGFGRVLGRLVTMRRQRVGHAVAVIDIHLTAIGLDEDALGRGGCGMVGLAHGAVFTRRMIVMPCPCNRAGVRVL